MKRSIALSGVSMIVAIALGASAAASYVHLANHELISKAIAVCDEQTAAVSSGAYGFVSLQAIVSSLGQIRQLADQTRINMLRTDGQRALDVLDSRIGAELADAQSGRWSYYTLATTASLMQELKSDLLALRSAAER